MLTRTSEATPPRGHGKFGHRALFSAQWPQQVSYVRHVKDCLRPQPCPISCPLIHPLLFIRGSSRSEPSDNIEPSGEPPSLRPMAPSPKPFVLDRRESTRSKTTSEAIQSESVHGSVTVFALGPFGVQPGRFIHILDNSSLLNIFCLYRLVLQEKHAVNKTLVPQEGEWCHERWWYKLAHVCQRWRSLILESALHLHLCLVCTFGTPVATMLEYSPPFPLIIDYIVEKNHGIAGEDAEGMFIVAIDGEFPGLQYLHIGPPTKYDAGLILPKTFRAPHLHHLRSMSYSFPIGSPLLTTAISLATLSLQKIHPSAYFRPNDLLQRLSHMPQLETLKITFQSPIPDRDDIVVQLLDTPIMTHITLPNLRWFTFGGASAYLEALLPRMTVPLLRKLNIMFSHQLTYSVPCLRQFMSTTGNLRLSTAKFGFHHGRFTVWVRPYKGAMDYAFYMHVDCIHLDWQVASAAQVFDVFSPVFSTVESVILDYRRHLVSSEWRNEADRTQWRKLLRSFRNVKTLRVHNGIMGELATLFNTGRWGATHGTGTRAEGARVFFR
ncbi:hypothetical protein BC826DRAFT_640621 [Russula brevipes]|nr:hypothetical protein BC826DRAFT_640621 [Russula brevipes]